ncbi:MAG: YbaB/EbfC family nucleoid-associated protein [Oscillospiraceae bacterium]|nr:YbaB/EbfC family nucleoid-associated protein [Oscillospiraceae bacterium]
MAKGGFRGMPGGMNQAAMIKQAQKMQMEMQRMQEEMENKTYTAAAGGGMVKASVNGKHELVNLEINPEAVDPDDVEMLQDMVIAAVNEAMRAADTEAANNMSRLTGGLNLGGLF